MGRAAERPPLLPSSIVRKNGLTINIIPMIRKRNMDIETVTVTVASGDTDGYVACRAGSNILGFYPTAGDQVVESVFVSGSQVTVTLAAAATADNTFVINLIK